MENNLNVEKIRSYSNDFSNIVCRKFFTTKDRISGNEILTLTPVKQINLFILKNLLNQWENEGEKFKSSYFDYNSEEVQKALNNFLNVLSQNISVARQDLEPLLIQAVSDSLILILSPYEYYHREISSWKGQIDLYSIKKAAKYIHVNRHLIDCLISRIEKKDFGELDVKKVRFLFDEVCEKTAGSPEDSDEHLKLLSTIIPAKSGDFFTIEEEIIYKKAKKEEDIAEQRKILAETFITNSPTLNERFVTETKSTLAEKLQKGKIQSIKSSIPINQKFIYINNLFGGNIQDFAAAVDEIDECPSFENARSVINARLVPKYNWDTNEETFIDFMHTIQRKYL